MFVLWRPLQIVNFILGALVVIKRILLLIFGLILSFWRLDKQWTASDSGHAAWCAMVVQDCTSCALASWWAWLCMGWCDAASRCMTLSPRSGRQSNPVLIVFCDIMFKGTL